MMNNHFDTQCLDLTSSTLLPLVQQDLKLRAFTKVLFYEGIFTFTEVKHIAFLTPWVCTFVCVCVCVCVFVYVCALGTVWELGADPNK